MNKYLLLTLVALTGVTAFLNHNRLRLLKDLAESKNNVSVLMQGVEHYKTKDSLNAVAVQNLTLDLNSYKKYREADAKIIESLKTRNRELEKIASTQTETIYDFQTDVRDSIVYVDSSKHVYKCFSYSTDYADIKGCVSPQNTFAGTFVSRDSLIYVESVSYKRFLGFLWRTNKILDRKQDIVSKNPNTQITNAEFITIKN